MEKMEKRDLIFLAAACASSQQFNGDVVTDKEDFKNCFNRWYQVYYELYGEMAAKTQFSFEFV